MTSVGEIDADGVEAEIEEGAEACAARADVGCAEDGKVRTKGASVEVVDVAADDGKGLLFACSDTDLEVVKAKEKAVVEGCNMGASVDEIPLEIEVL